MKRHPLALHWKYSSTFIWPAIFAIMGVGCPRKARPVRDLEDNAVGLLSRFRAKTVAEIVPQQVLYLRFLRPIDAKAGVKTIPGNHNSTSN
ncbi:hypothetical protein [Bradyrhizobium lablabi]|uniref:hypothetical protein n=1 Tax=Bradyrhizobium lablabi TaxID=722472 RepID=UPI0012E34F17|nr:hypothetical protein [Bradyrhizobium lablabi]